MSPLAKAQPFPNLYLDRPDGTSLELFDLRKKQHALLVLLDKPDPCALAFVGLFQDQAGLFTWLDTRLLAVFSKSARIPTPWPAPGYPACMHAEALPSGVEWGRSYVVSKHGTLLELYGDVSELSIEKIESDLLYWEAGHCLH